MRYILFCCVAVAGLAATLPAVAATHTPSSATVTIVIPAFPAASVAAAIKKAMGHMPNFRIVKPGETMTSKAPPGVLKFAAGEVNRTTTAEIGNVASLYPAKLPDGRKGHLVLVVITTTFTANPFSSASSSPHAQLISVVQPDTSAFRLHQGERVVLVRSTVNGWARVLPYNGPNLSHQRQ
ncbi:MAG: hypothetical protein ACRESR_01345 [Gammaproteobacteria bacterium]